MNRRALILSASALIGTTALGGVATFRLHRTPSRFPGLTPEHLESIAKADLPRPRVLFIGNSMVIRHDLPLKVAALAKAEGREISVASASANGARLIETLRISALDSVLREDYWDAVVLQDFTETPLRAPDRWGSAFAMGRIAKSVAPAKIVLYPPMPGAEGHPIYQDAGTLKAQPDSPSDYAARTMAHYTRIARANGFHVAPVPQRWLEEVAKGAQLYHDDGHHPNARGTALAAKVIWETLSPLFEDPS